MNSKPMRSHAKKQKTINWVIAALAIGALVMAAVLLFRQTVLPVPLTSLTETPTKQSLTAFMKTGDVVTLRGGAELCLREAKGAKTGREWRFAYEGNCSEKGQLPLEDKQSVTLEYKDQHHEIKLGDCDYENKEFKGCNVAVDSVKLDRVVDTAKKFAQETMIGVGAKAGYFSKDPVVYYQGAEAVTEKTERLYKVSFLTRRGPAVITYTVQEIRDKHRKSIEVNGATVSIDILGVRSPSCGDGCTSANQLFATATLDVVVNYSEYGW